jgi:hypothetical protein
MCSRPAFVIVSGGPGLRKDCDKKHDQSWSNYVDAILNAARTGQLLRKDEAKVVWMVYEPAYALRWQDDKIRKLLAVKDVEREGFHDYLHKLQMRAQRYGFDYRPLTKAADFWDRLAGMQPNAVSRLWYFGHGQESLWLRLNHNSGCVAAAPDPAEIISSMSIAARAPSLRNRIYRRPGSPRYDRHAATKFYGCRTSLFALEWAKAFGTFAEGASLTLEFEDTWKPGLQDVFAEYERRSGWKKFRPDGSSF